MPIEVARYLPPDHHAATEAALTPLANGMTGSMILAIARQIRELKAEGREVSDLTLGDFRPPHFHVPAELAERLQQAVRDGETYYPPPDGIPELRSAVARLYERELGLSYGPESVCIASGARPSIFAAWRLFVEPGDRTVSFVPAWNAGYYAHMAQSDHRFVTTAAEHRFFPTVDQAVEALRGARLVMLNTPLNPTGTTIPRPVMQGIAEALVEENRHRERPCILLLDQVYWMLRAGGAEHHNPVTLVPAAAPWVIHVDAISKWLAATGLRVGWSVLPPYLQPAMGTLIGHMGAWAPRPVQVAAAWFLDRPELLHAFVADLNERLGVRLTRLYEGICSMRARGLPVDAIPPHGAMFLCFRVDLIGRGFDTNEQIRSWLLERAGIAVIPFQAFDMPEENGWFRVAVGATDLEGIERFLERLEHLLADVRLGSGRAHPPPS